MTFAGQDRPFPLFTEAGSAEAVNARMGQDVDPRLAELIGSAVAHLHAFIKDVRLSEREWMEAIRFLTETGRMCTDWRQEFILLSDILGASMLVDSISHQRPSGATENTVLGPFHVADVPLLQSGETMCKDGKGEPLLIAGRVTDIDGIAVAGAVLDVWQTNDDGFYDVQQPGIQPEHNLRGRYVTDESGRFFIRTIKPRPYPIPDDGPVGKLLGRLGRHPNRASHIHFIITSPGHDKLTTHIFTDDCEFLAEDAVFGVKLSLVATARRASESDVAELGAMAGEWVIERDFVLAPSES